MTTTKGPRDRGSGSVFTRSDGHVVAVFPLGVHGGKRLRRTYYAKDETDARGWLREQAKKRKVRTATEDRYSVGAQLTEWLETVEVKPSTMRRYRQIVTLQLMPTLGSVPLVELTTSDVRKAMHALHRGGLSPQSVAHCRAVLRTALELAVADRRIEVNPAAGRHAAGPSVAAHETQYLGTADARRLLAAVTDAMPTHPRELPALGAADRLGALWAVALVTGARQGELLGLTWADVDIEAGTVTIRASLQRDKAGQLTLGDPKTAKSKGRVLPLTPEAVRAMQSHRARMIAECGLLGSSWRGAKWDGKRILSGAAWRGPKSAVDPAALVFTTGLGTPLSGPRVTGLWHEWADRHGLPRVRFHALRHSAATLHLAIGTDPRIVSDLLGHSTGRLLQRYQHVALDLRAEAVAKLGILLGEDVAQ
jgi:integrase